MSSHLHLLERPTVSRQQAPTNPVILQRPADSGAGDARPSATIAARFDPPHPMRTADAAQAHAAELSQSHADADQASASPQTSGCAIAAPAVASLPDELREELSRHASELANHLRAEADDLDRREAQVHALQSELEQQRRSASLWLAEERAALDDRAAALDQREREVDRRAADIAAAEQYLDAARATLDQRLASLAQTAGTAAPGAARAVSTAASKDGRSPHSQQPATQPAERLGAAGEWLELERSWTELRSRQAQLSEQQQQWSARQQQVEEARQALELHRARLVAQLEADREALTQRSATLKRALTRRMSVLERRRAALDKLAAQVKERYRQALHIRLVTERLSRQLLGDRAATILQRAAQEARELLEQDERHAEEELARQSAALEQGRSDLARREASLVKQRAKLAAWCRQRGAESAAEQVSNNPSESPQIRQRTA